MKTWNERYKAMKKAFKWTNEDVAELTGNTVDSIKSMTQPSKGLPRNMKFAIIVFEKCSKNND